MSKLHWFILLFGWIIGAVGAFLNLYIPKKERDEARYNFKSEITEVHLFSMSWYLYWPSVVAIIAALYYFFMSFGSDVESIGGGIISTAIVLLAMVLIFLGYITVSMSSMIFIEIMKALVLIKRYEKIGVEIKDDPEFE